MSDEIDATNTGRVRLIVQQEVKSEVNGFFTAGEKFLRRAKFLITVLAMAAGSVLAVDHWLNSLAKKAELEQLSTRVALMGAQLTTILQAIDKLQQDMDRTKKWGH